MVFKRCQHRSDGDVCVRVQDCVRVVLRRILSSKREARVLPIMDSRDVYGLWLRLASLRLLRSVR